MKSILFYSLLTILVFTGCKASETASKRSNQTPEQEAIMAVSAINNHDFVLEANYIIPKTGASIYVSSNTNFISVQGNQATIQLALSNQFSGLNGIGGITLNGTISNEKVSIDKKGNLTYNVNIQGAALSAMVSFSMPAGTNRCTATVIPNFSGNIITFSGFVYPTNMSNIYMANPSF